MASARKKGNVFIIVSFKIYSHYFFHICNGLPPSAIKSIGGEVIRVRKTVPSTPASIPLACFAKVVSNITVQFEVVVTVMAVVYLLT
ncbi:MAG: hypothetical protein IKI36_04990 [Prevotella sp.]|nr:hypothetical protein [Prevotella sp.]